MDVVRQVFIVGMTNVDVKFAIGLKSFASILLDVESQSGGIVQSLIVGMKEISEITK